MRIDHINIVAPWDLLEEVKDFYCAILDLKVGARPNFSIRGYWLYGGDNALVHLMERDKDFDTTSPRHLDHVAFSLEEQQPFIERLERLGIEYTVDYIPDFDISQVFCSDPCGNGVEANIKNSK